ncbi:unnamed protein product [Orchesella dallaii]|uniref:Enkurin domain-containing protein n=1 Tax=Orchesella dallaii TaxID=48710 RepID=A0ABP1RA09_9HEXA
MASRSVGSAPPPFYWKVSVPEKDYMSENYRRIRQIANQAQRKRSEPLKAAFVPGVTKNEKYAHVPSRVGEFLKTKKPPNGKEEPLLQSRRPTQAAAQRNISTSNEPINRRLSRSSVDLRSSNINPNPVNTAPNSNFSNSFQTRQRRVSEDVPHHPSESVYNWRFKDDVIQPVSVVNQSSGANFSNGFHNPSLPTKYCHRVEYLPCDGICAEENFIVDDTQPESARSASSCRTSRGCNTEETRILEDPLKSFSQTTIRPVDKNLESAPASNLEGGVQMPKSRSVLTVPSRQVENGRGKETFEWFQTKTVGNDTNDIGRRLNSMKVSSTQQPENGRVKTSVSCSSLKSFKTPQMNGDGGAGDFPHSLGTVPKYLKQRQEEWKIQEQERKEAEMNANVPHGYVLLSDDERLEHLRSFKRNYDALINELNRIPIRIDTMRVRDHKVQLEQQLTRLEEAMKTFSRPRVWVKTDG